LIKIDIQDETITELLANAPLYEKFATVTAREVLVAEEIRTLVGDGFVETTNAAEVGDFVVTNPTGEEYILKLDKFTARYEATDKKGTYKASGLVRAISNPYMCEIEIDAPWGAPQYGESLCLLATTVDDEHSEVGTDRYIIEFAAFKETYRLV
jgi:hypothetical protein